MTFAELGITSNFTFLTGGAHPEEYAWEAAYQGIAAIAIADENSVAGIVRAHVALRDVARRAEERRAALAETGRIGPPAPPDAPRPPSADLACLPRLIPGAKLVLRDGLTVTALPQDRAAWGRLCRLLTLGRRRAKKGDCDLNTADLLGRLTDVLTCIRTGTTVDALGRAAQANAEQRLRSEAEMRRIFAGHGDAVDRTGAIAARCGSTLDELRYEYPSEIDDGRNPVDRLSRLAKKGCEWRYPRGPPGACAKACWTTNCPDREAPLRALFPDRARHRRLRPLPRHPVPGARLGGQFGGLLCAGRHLGQPRDRHHGLRTLRLRGPERAPRHRRRFRT
jgi:DNA polymerase III alpha subunit